MISLRLLALTTRRFFGGRFFASFPAGRFFSASSFFTTAALLLGSTIIHGCFFLTTFPGSFRSAGFLGAALLSAGFAFTCHHELPPHKVYSPLGGATSPRPP